MQVKIVTKSSLNCEQDKRKQEYKSDSSVHSCDL